MPLAEAGLQARGVSQRHKLRPMDQPSQISSIREGNKALPGSFLDQSGNSSLSSLDLYYSYCMLRQHPGQSFLQGSKALPSLIFFAQVEVSNCVGLLAEGPLDLDALQLVSRFQCCLNQANCFLRRSKRRERRFVDCW